MFNKKMTDNFITLNVPFVISRQTVADILCSAFEGGIGYWAQITNLFSEGKKVNINTVFAHEIPLKGGTLYFRDVETVEYLGYLDEKKIIKAFEMMAEGKDKNGRDIPLRHIKAIITGNFDAENADVLVQLAVMGEIVFG